MGIYNCRNTLTEAISCLQAQTFSDWECILCDDGSTDDTYSVAEYLCQQDPRLHLIRNIKNQGLAFTLNRCLSKASGEYIARMDGDDRCLPERFALQSSFLDNHPNYSIVSAWMECFDSKGSYGIVRYPAEPCLQQFIYRSPFCHASAMIRKNALEQVNGYQTLDKVSRVEDYDLWIRMYESGYLGYNMQKILYQMRDDRNAARRRKMKYRLNESRLKWHLFKTLHLPVSQLFQVILPIIKGILPLRLYQYFHRKKVGR